MNAFEDLALPHSVSNATARYYIDRWHHSKLEAQLRREAAASLRSATQLHGMARIFDSLGNAVESSVLRAAANVCTGRAHELKLLCGWASVFAKKSEVHDEQERIQRLDSLAAARWSDDHEAMAEARDLVAFYRKSVGDDEIDAFLADQKPFGAKSVSLNRSEDRAALALARLPEMLASGDAQGVRRSAIQLIESMPPCELWNGIWFPGKSAYGAWREHRLGGAA